MNGKTLTAAPIIKASIAAGFNANKGVSLEKLKLFSDEIASKYPVKGQVADQHFQFGSDNENVPFQKFAMTHRGFAVSNKSGTKTISLELDRYQSILNNSYYPPWPGLKDFFFENYGGYISSSSYKEISSLSTQMINRLFFPFQEGLSLSEYINTTVSIPTSDEIPDAISGFRTDVLVPLGDGYTARIIQQTEDVSLDQRTGESGLGFILDVNVTFNGIIPALDKDKLSSIMDTIRAKRNAIFFSTFTDKALERYE